MAQSIESKTQLWNKRLRTVAFQSTTIMADALGTQLFVVLPAVGGDVSQSGICSNSEVC